MSFLEPIRTSFRRYVRIDCQVVREHDFRMVGDLALDLSTKGMLVRANERVLTGEEVVVSFKLPRSNEWFDAQGVVARVLHGRRPGDYGLSFGIEFVNLSN
ncbi:MAG: PilZ domain-containing protein, partial [Myxococcales bacterium]|nr:PilZ domain-containing protein [Myxococcales bacterium]